MIELIKNCKVGIKSCFNQTSMLTNMVTPFEFLVALFNTWVKVYCEQTTFPQIVSVCHWCFFLQNLTPGVLPPLPRPVDDYTLGDIVLGTPKIVEDCEADGKHLDDYLPVCPSTSCHLSVHFITSMTLERFFFSV